MEIFITEKFIDDFEKHEKYVYSNHLVNSVNIVNKIRTLVLSGLAITCNITNSELVKSYDDSGNKNYLNFKDVFSTSFIKSGKYKFLSLEKFKEIVNYNAYYFLELNSVNPNSHGIVNVNDISTVTHFFENCTVNSRSFSDDYTIIQEATPPCNAMFYIDKYLFASKIKVDNFIKFITLYKKEPMDISFQLTIISSYENNGKSIPKIILEYAEMELNKLDNLQFEILLDKNIPDDDRLIFTNYTKGSIGHPFDDRPTVFNQNFLGTSSNIQCTYEDFISNLKKWNSFKNKIPNNLGLIKTKYSNSIFTNRLFTNN